MKIAVTAKGKTLDDEVEPRFGRCRCFFIVDADTMSAEAIPNPNLALDGGAGVQSAQVMIRHDVQVVLTGTCGPSACRALEAAGIELVIGASGRVGQAVEQFKSGGLSSGDVSNIASHFGMGTGTVPQPGGSNHRGRRQRSGR